MRKGTILLSAAIAVAMLSGMTTEASACRIPQRPMTEAEQARRADLNLVSSADGIAIAEVIDWGRRGQPFSGPAFRIESTLRGHVPAVVSVGDEIISSTCGPYGNDGYFDGGKVGDRVVLFVLQDLIIHAEPVDTPRAAALLSIIPSDNP
jgi:hypothetical protein